MLAILPPSRIIIIIIIIINLTHRIFLLNAIPCVDTFHNDFDNADEMTLKSTQEALSKALSQLSIKRTSLSANRNVSPAAIERFQLRML